MEGQARAFGGEAAPRWVAANLAGFTLGGALAGGVLRFLGQPFYGNIEDAIEAAALQTAITGLGTAVFGIVIGTAEWVVLRGTLRAGWWPAATVAGWVLTGIVIGVLAGLSGSSVSDIGPGSGPVPVAVSAPVGLAAALLVFGSFQWLVLRQQTDGANAWPLASPLALMAGLAAGFFVVRFLLVEVVPLLHDTDFPSAQALVLVGAVSGLVYGLLTWPALARLRPRIVADVYTRDVGPSTMR